MLLIYGIMVHGYIIIFGTSEFSEYVYLTIKKEDQIEVIGFTVDKLHFEKTGFNGERVYVFEELGNYFDMQECGVLLTVGYTRMNEIRRVPYFPLNGIP